MVAAIRFLFGFLLVFATAFVITSLVYKLPSIYLYVLTFVLTGISFIITTDLQFEYRALGMMDIILVLTIIAFGFAMYFFWVEWISVPSSPCP